jgi:hypothetical protein
LHKGICLSDALRAGVNKPACCFGSERMNTALFAKEEVGGGERFRGRA